MARKSEANVTEQLRAAIVASDRRLLELGRAAGVSHAILSRFVRGERGLTLDTAAKVCAALGLELAPKRKGK